MKLIEDPVEYHTKKTLEKEKYFLDKKEYERILRSWPYRLAAGTMFIKKKLIGGVKCAQQLGVVYTFFYGIKKVTRFVVRKLKARRLKK